jgi:hypothetical protein
VIVLDPLVSGTAAVAGARAGTVGGDTSASCPRQPGEADSASTEDNATAPLLIRRASVMAGGALGMHSFSTT